MRISIMKRNSFRQHLACLLIAGSSAAFLIAAPDESPAQTATLPDAATNLSLSVNAPSQRAQWQQRLTLGAGDSLSIVLFNMPETAVREVPVAPDGRISFLQAHDVMAAGLTIDELRAKLDEALGKYYQSPRTIITPVAFRSKKYYVLGAVMAGGVYTLERPLTVVEALARAGGLETGLYERNTVELADLSRSFLVRNGKRLSIDFERLFQRGDLSQNIPLEPDDYLYFALANSNEIYVFGEVGMPGVAAFLPRTTVVGAITARGGFQLCGPSGVASWSSAAPSSTRRLSS